MEQNCIGFKGECSSEVLEEQFLNCFCWTKDLQANKLQGVLLEGTASLCLFSAHEHHRMDWAGGILETNSLPPCCHGLGPSTHHPSHLQVHRFFICLGFAQFSGPAGVCCCQVPLDVTSCATCLSSTAFQQSQLRSRQINLLENAENKSSKPAPQPCLFPCYEK